MSVRKNKVNLCFSAHMDHIDDDEEFFSELDPNYKASCPASKSNYKSKANKVSKNRYGHDDRMTQSHEYDEQIVDSSYIDISLKHSRKPVELSFDQVDGLFKNDSPINFRGGYQTQRGNQRTSGDTSNFDIPQQSHYSGRTVNRNYDDVDGLFIKDSSINVRGGYQTQRRNQRTSGDTFNSDIPLKSHFSSKTVNRSFDDVDGYFMKASAIKIGGEYQSQGWCQKISGDNSHNGPFPAKNTYRNKNSHDREFQENLPYRSSKLTRSYPNSSKPNDRISCKGDGFSNDISYKIYKDYVANRRSSHAEVSESDCGGEPWPGGDDDVISISHDIPNSSLFNTQKVFVKSESEQPSDQIKILNNSLFVNNKSFDYSLLDTVDGGDYQGEPWPSEDDDITDCNEALGEVNVLRDSMTRQTNYSNCKFTDELSTSKVSMLPVKNTNAANNSYRNNYSHTKIVMNQNDSIGEPWPTDDGKKNKNRKFQPKYDQSMAQHDHNKVRPLGNQNYMNFSRPGTSKIVQKENSYDICSHLDSDSSFCEGEPWPTDDDDVGNNINAQPLLPKHDQSKSESFGPKFNRNKFKSFEPKSERSNVQSIVNPRYAKNSKPENNYDIGVDSISGSADFIDGGSNEGEPWPTEVDDMQLSSTQIFSKNSLQEERLPKSHEYYPNKPNQIASHSGESINKSANNIGNDEIAFSNSQNFKTQSYYYGEKKTAKSNFSNNKFRNIDKTYMKCIDISRSFHDSNVQATERCAPDRLNKLGHENTTSNVDDGEPWPTEDSDTENNSQETHQKNRFHGEIYTNRKHLSCFPSKNEQNVLQSEPWPTECDSDDGDPTAVSKPMESGKANMMGDFMKRCSIKDTYTGEPTDKCSQNSVQLHSDMPRGGKIPEKHEYMNHHHKRLPNKQSYQVNSLSHRDIKDFEQRDSRCQLRHRNQDPRPEDKVENQDSSHGCEHRVVSCLSEVVSYDVLDRPQQNNDSGVTGYIDHVSQKLTKIDQNNSCDNVDDVADEWENVSDDDCDWEDVPDDFVDA